MVISPERCVCACVVHLLSVVCLCAWCRLNLEPIVEEGCTRMHLRQEDLPPSGEHECIVPGTRMPYIASDSFRGLWTAALTYDGLVDNN